MKSKRKKAAMAVSLALSISMLLTGTFAWRSISQEAKNEIVRLANNPGGRLHDDFNGENKDVYVENFMSANEGGEPIFARVRLDEYMEIGEDAGEKVDDPTRKAESVAESSKDPTAKADIKDTTTWRTHIPGDAKDPFHDYWTWALGGEKVFMPTFNKNKDSLKADIKGTKALNYSDYKSYVLGDKETDAATYDADDNDIEDAGVTTAVETHEAKETLNATVVTMAEWEAAGCPVGPIWVYDTDGWAYWAQAIQPGEATGLLLDGIQFTGKLDENCYYSINVVGQFATAGDWGSAATKEGFYADNAGGAPSDKALYLLKQAAARELTAEVTKSDGSALDAETVVAQGGSMEFKVKMTVDGTDAPSKKAAWKVEGAAEAGTAIDADGKLTVDGAEAPDTELTVTATVEGAEPVTFTVKVGAATPAP